VLDNAGVPFDLFADRIIECGCDTGLGCGNRRTSSGDTAVQPAVLVRAISICRLHTVDGNRLS